MADILRRSYTYQELIQAAETEPTGMWRQGYHSVRNVASDSWDFGCGYNGALSYLRDGWVDGTNLLQAAIVPLANPTDVTSTVDHDVTGIRPNVPLFCAGDPAHMQMFREEPKRPIMRLGMEWSISCDVSADSLLYYGAALVSVIDAIEASGISVELTVYIIGGTRSERSPDAHFACIVKEAAQPLELERIAFCVAHVGFFRRIGFRLIELEPSLYDGYGQSYGRVRCMHADEVDDDIVMFPSMDRMKNTRSTDEAIEKCVSIYTQTLENIS